MLGAMTRSAAVLVAAATFAAFPMRAVAQNAGRHEPSWSTAHIALASAFAVALWIDAAQTRSLAERGWQGYREANPILGPHPTAGRVNTYTAVAALSALGIAAAAPGRTRSWVLGVALAIETFTIAGTVREGIAIRF